MVGTLKDFFTLTKRFPHTKYEYGTSYNSYSIKSLYVNAWNRGTRLSVAPWYAHGDDGPSMKLGTTMFVHGTDDSKGTWTHYYYQENIQGKLVYHGSNGNVNTQPFFVSKRAYPWVYAGKLSTLATMIQKNYPLTKYKLGIKYNTIHGAVHDATVTTWNKGTRVRHAHCYPRL